MRSSWLASPTKRRICSIVRARSAKAWSILLSIALSERFRRPTSVFGVAPAIRAG